MVKLIRIYSDGHVDSFDNNNLKVEHYSGQWSMVLHTLVEVMFQRSQSNLEQKFQVVNPKIKFSIPNQKEELNLSKEHLREMVRYIKTGMVFSED